MMILALTLPQLIGAVPLARLGKRHNAIHYLKFLILIRALALGSIGLLAATGAPFFTLVIASAIARLVNGAAFGFLRSVLNYLVTASELPRALGVAATVNEVIFVSAPVLVSTLGAVSPVFAVVALTIIGAAPLVLLPAVSQATPTETSRSRGSALSPAILLWLLCALASSSPWRYASLQWPGACGSLSATANLPRMSSSSIWP